MKTDEDVEDAEVNVTAAIGAANGNSSSDGADYFYQVEQLTFLWILFTLIVLGNSTVLVALTVSKARKSRMNFFIRNLAAADLCVGLVSVLTDIIWKITISWEAGLVACKIIRFSQATVTYASTYVLVALSIDRYDAIAHPMNFTRSWRRAKSLVAAAWILSMVFSAPILHFYETAETRNYGTQCWIEFDQPWKWRLYMTLVSLSVFVIPAIIIAACYVVIVCTIWSKGKEMTILPSSVGAVTTGLLAAASTTAMQQTSVASVANVANASAASNNCQVIISRRKQQRLRKKALEDIIEVGSPPASSKPLLGSSSPASVSEANKKPSLDDPESRRASSRGLIPKAKVKTVKMTFVIIFVFILCWSPYIVFDLLQVYGCIPDNSTSRAIATFIQSMAPLNSAANPLIYCLFSTNAGQTFCNLCFGLGWCSRRRRSDKSSVEVNNVGALGGAKNGSRSAPAHAVMSAQRRQQLLADAASNNSNSSSKRNSVDSRRSDYVNRTRSSVLTLDSSSSASSRAALAHQHFVKNKQASVSWSSSSAPVAPRHADVPSSLVTSSSPVVVIVTNNL